MTGAESKPGGAQAGSVRVELDVLLVQPPGVFVVCLPVERTPCLQLPMLPPEFLDVRLQPRVFGLETLLHATS